jgi:hypothetical protein
MNGYVALRRGRFYAVIYEGRVTEGRSVPLSRCFS